MYSSHPSSLQLIYSIPMKKSCPASLINKQGRVKSEPLSMNWRIVKGAKQKIMQIACKPLKKFFDSFSNLHSIIALTTPKFWISFGNSSIILERSLPSSYWHIGQSQLQKSLSFSFSSLIYLNMIFKLQNSKLILKILDFLF